MKPPSCHATLVVYNLCNTYEEGKEFYPYASILLPKLDDLLFEQSMNYLLIKERKANDIYQLISTRLKDDQHHSG